MTIRLVRAAFLIASLWLAGRLEPAAAGDAAPASSSSSPRQRTLLDAGWTFHLGDITPATQVVAADFDDKDWRRVDVPHDYVLEGKYSRSDEKTVRGHGYLPYDVAWYRKRFTIPGGDRGKVLRLDFDGVFRDSEVYLNGKSLGRHPSGYTPFSYDITNVAKAGGDENTIVVRVDPREFEGWWYEGAGIYRHVWLTALSPLHVAQWGTSVTTKVRDGDQGASQHADATVQIDVENRSSDRADFRVACEIVAPAGETVKTFESPPQSVAGNETRQVVQNVALDNPRLWSLDSPQLYQLRTTILSGDGDKATVVDRTTTSFGIRTLRFDADKGFFLNGKHVRIQGAASHQDFAGVGIAVPDSLQEWRVRQLKQLGCNGWRTAHNEPSEALLDACDHLGMLVMAENRHLGDTYRHHSQPGTTADDLSDLATMIRRDRNHASIIMWSMCNEEGLQGRPEGVAIFKKMMDVVHKYDQTRPITAATNGGWMNPQHIAQVMDIVGINYHIQDYDKIRSRFANKMIFASECMNEKTTRGEYADVPETGMRSCYNLSEEAFLAVANRPYFAGAYMWTGFDYKGEPNPYGWPDISNNTGLLDVCGFPKDKGCYFQSCWSDKPMVHLVPGTWNWPGKEGQNIRVLAFSNAKRVELFLNGKSFGASDMPHDAHVEWQVPYAPGTLSAKAYDGDKVVASDAVETTGAPTHIKLTADRTSLRAASEDAIVVAVALLDDKDRIVSNADRRITFAVKGTGRILGVGNGNPADHDTDKADNRNTFHGRCIAVVEAGAAGEIEVSATSPQLADGRVIFHAD